MVSNKKDQVIPLLGPNNIGSTCNGSTPQIYEYMPIDFLKVELINFDVNNLLNNPLLNFSRKVNEDTGEIIIYESKDGYTIQNPRKAEYKNLVFIIQDNGKIYMHGSLHKYSNEGLHNYNDFIQLRFKRALNRLKIEFNILPVNIRIQTLEFGLNITPPHDTNKILMSCFQHRQRSIIETIPNSKGKYKQVIGNKFILKLYNKSKQYLDKKYNGKFKIPCEIMRIEIKQTNWTEIRKLGIDTLQDYIDSDKTYFVNRLIDIWNELIFFNPLNLGNGVNSKYSNPLFWDGLKEKSNNTYFKHSKRLKEMNKHPVDLQKQVALTMLKKIQSLQPSRLK